MIYVLIFHSFFQITSPFSIYRDYPLSFPDHLTMSVIYTFNPRTLSMSLRYLLIIIFLLLSVLFILFIVLYVIIYSFPLPFYLIKILSAIFIERFFAFFYTIFQYTILSSIVQISSNFIRTYSHRSLHLGLMYPRELLKSTFSLR